MIKIEITSEIGDRTSQAGKPYHQQVAYAYTLDRDGKPKKYPEELLIYLPTRAEAYAPGVYTLDPRCINVQERNLRLGRLQLRPLEQK